MRNVDFCLPPIPEKVNRNENCSVLLTDRRQTEWQFLFEKIKDIPDAFSNCQDYDFGALDESKWRDIIVPSSLVMQGLDIENNIEYYYKRKVAIPDSFKGNRIFLRFEGVYSNARVWVNNKFIASHIGGFTVWDADISGFAHEAEITVIIGVADLEGSKKSPWNPNGAYQSSSAWASYYAHHNIGGIIRDITMFCLPQNAILQTHIDTVIGGDKSTAKINMLFSDGCVGHSAKAEVLKENEIKAEKRIKITKPSVCFAVDVLFADLWDAEHPNLYTLKIILYDENGGDLQENTIKFGFREITYAGAKGTDKNRIYVNGREIKLRGVCRHDVSRLYGRSVTKEDIYNEIKTYKEHNINHIRTSHYPACEYMLSVCDELGVYVEQENAACFKGANGFEIYNPPEDFLNSFKEMIEFSRNHPSVIIWSVANESDFEKSSGFRDCFNYVKKADLTRPVIFSYPQTVKSKPLPYDIYSRHYKKVTSKLGKKSIPVLHDEFAHVPCYNIDALATDNSPRVFWGESIKRGWENIFNTPGALGCDIWAAADDVFYLPEKSMERHQTHLRGECAGYGEWGCIFDAFQRLKPEAYLTKKAFSPVHILETAVFGDEIRLRVQNRFDHANMNEVLVTVKDETDKILYSEKVKENIAPHSSATVSVSPVCCADNMTVEFSFGGMTAESIVVNEKQKSLKIIPAALKCRCKKDAVEICENNEAIAQIRGMFLCTGGKSLKIKRCGIKRIKNNAYLGKFENGVSFFIEPCILQNTLKIKVRPANILALLCRIGEVGIDIAFKEEAKSVAWTRNALYNAYPKKHIARACGTAYKVGKAHSYRDTDMRAVLWEQDMSAFAYYGASSKSNRIACNDFRTKRLKIKEYRVDLQDSKAVLIKTESKNINSYFNPFRSRLEVGKGNYNKSLLWGNYWGEKFRLCKKNDFEILIIAGKENENE